MHLEDLYIYIYIYIYMYIYIHTDTYINIYGYLFYIYKYIYLLNPQPSSLNPQPSPQMNLPPTSTKTAQLLVSCFVFRVSGPGFRDSERICRSQDQNDTDEDPLRELLFSQGFGCRVSNAGFQVQDLGRRFSGLGFRVQGFGFRLEGFEFRVSGARVENLAQSFERTVSAAVLSHPTSNAAPPEENLLITRPV